MCLAIYKPKDISIPESNLMEGFKSNPDGAGYAIKQQNGEIEIKKGFNTFQKFINSYSDVNPNLEALIHFRIKTSGEINAYNCHPFWIGKKEETVLIHNGILRGFPTTPKLSDTHYACKYIFPSVIGGLDKDSMQFLLEKAIGSGNKLVIMRKGVDKETVIINKSAGNVDKDIWYSNNSYRTYINTTYSSSMFPYSCYGDATGYVNRNVARYNKEVAIHKNKQKKAKKVEPVIIPEYSHEEYIAEIKKSS